MRGVRYFGVVWTQVFGTFSHPLNITWMSLTCEDSEERALAMAMYVHHPATIGRSSRLMNLDRVIMGANIAGIYGAQIFRSDDRPRYRRAFSVNCAILSVGLLLAIVRYIDDKLRRRRKIRRLSHNHSRRESVVSVQLEEDEKNYASPPSADDQPGSILLGANGKPVTSAGLRGI